MRKELVFALLLTACAGTAQKPAQAGAAQVAPPVAPKHPKAIEQHGETRVDDYAWLRAKDSPEVLAYLHAENAYTEAFMRPTEALQSALYSEIVGRIQQTDETPPVRRGAYVYYSRTTEGQQYPVYCRKRTGPDANEAVLLDLNALAEREKFLDVGEYEVSDDGNLLAFSLDTTGFREYTLQVKDLRTGALSPERIAKVSSSAWAADNRTLFYSVEDDAKRSYRIYRHVLGQAPEHDALVFQEKDERFSVDVSRTRSKAYVLLTSASHTASEVRFIPADKPEADPRVIAERRDNHEYYVDHRGELLYIRTNDHERNFRIATARVTDCAERSWHELVPPSDHVMLEDFAVFARFFAVHEREDGLPHVRVTELGSERPGAEAPALVQGSSRRIELPEAVYEIFPDENPEADVDAYRFIYESPITPTTYYDYRVADRSLDVVKRKAVLGGYDASRYTAERIHARAADGTQIPISLVYAKARPAGPQPMLLTGYGAYGFPYSTTFSYSRVSLLDRGVTFAIAHVRGGGELGKRWHDAGRMLNKRNTFDDFIAAAQQLEQDGHTARDRLVIEGASAGGLLIGAVVNQRPDLFKAALLDVPFVDVLNTMSDASLPLTVGEYEEWGNPQKRDEYRYIASYSPYDNIRAQPYPALLIKTSYNDSQVMYWEPAKYVAKLRATKTDHNPLLFFINMQAGHHGASGRYDQVRERAFDFAFFLTQLGIVKTPQ
jgi:oligopeptidase B